MTLSDELLLKFAEGRLDAATASAIAEQLQSDDVAKERLRLIELSGAALAEERGKPLPEAATAALRAKILAGDLDADAGSPTPEIRRSAARAPGARAWPRAGAIAAAVVLLAFGALFGALLHREYARRDLALSAHPAWVVRVVDYHTLYGRETVEPSKEPASSQLEARLSAALRHPVGIPDLSGDNLEFHRGQILRFDGAPIIQLVYLPERGAPLALCITPGASGPAAPHTARIRGMGVVRWASRGLEYLLVGHQAETELVAVAARIIERSRT